MKKAKIFLNFRDGNEEDSFSKCSMYNLSTQLGTQPLQGLNKTEYETGKASLNKRFSRYNSFMLNMFNVCQILIYTTFCK
jgi:hypothetical protein